MYIYMRDPLFQNFIEFSYSLIGCLTKAKKPNLPNYISSGKEVR